MLNLLRPRQSQLVIWAGWPDLENGHRHAAKRRVLVRREEEMWEEASRAGWPTSEGGESLGGMGVYLTVKKVINRQWTQSGIHYLLSGPCHNLPRDIIYRQHLSPPLHDLHQIYHVQHLHHFISFITQTKITEDGFSQIAEKDYCELD